MKQVAALNAQWAAHPPPHLMIAAIGRALGIETPAPPAVADVVDSESLESVVGLLSQYT